MSNLIFKKPTANRIFLLLLCFFAIPIGFCTDLNTLIKSLHQSDWFQSQTKRSTVLSDVIASDQPRHSWEIGFSRETQSGSVTEDFISLQRQFDSAWLKSVYREQSQLDAELQKLDFANYTRSKELEVYNLFYDALRIQDELELRTSYLQALNGLLKRLEYRIKQGDGAAYDLKRLRQQQVLENQTIQSLEASLSARKIQLKSFCLHETTVQKLQGTLLPEWSSSIQNDEINKLDANLKVRREGLELQRLQQNQKQLENRFFKNYTLEFGTKRIDEPGLDGSGAIFSFSTPVPLDDIHKQKRQRYQLMAELRLSELNQHKSYLTSQLSLLGTLIFKTVQQSKDQQELLIQSAISLHKTKEKAYQNGAGTLADLLDIRRHLLESHLQAQQTKYKARQAWLEFKTLLIGVEQ